MADDNDDEDQQPIDQPDTGGGDAYAAPAVNEFAKYAALPPAYSDNEFAKYAVSPDNEFAKYAQPQEPEEPESGPMAFGRRVLHSAIPTLAGALTSIPGTAIGSGIGTAIGAGLGTVTIPIPGVGTVAGAELGGTIGGFLGGGAGFFGGAAAASTAQKAATDALGIHDEQIMALNDKFHPWWSAAGEAAPMLAPFGGGAASVAQRAFYGGVAGLGEAGQQVATGDYSLPRLATAVGTGALLTHPRGWTDPAQLAGERAAAAIGYPTPAPFTLAARQPAAEAPPPPPPPLPPPAQPADLASTLRGMAAENPDNATHYMTIADNIENGTYGNWASQPPAALRAMAQSAIQGGREDTARTFNTIADAIDRTRAQAGQTAMPSGTPDVSEQPAVSASKVTAAARAKVAPGAGPITSAMRDIAGEVRDSGDEAHAQIIENYASGIDQGAFGQAVRQSAATLRAMATSQRAGGNEDLARGFDALAAAKERVRVAQRTSQTGVTMTPNERGTAAPMPSPTGETVGQPKVGLGSETQYGKAKPPPGPGAGVQVLEPGEMPAEQAAALEAAIPPGEELRVGDFVQWSPPSGGDQFKVPRRITAIDPKAGYAFVEGSNTGLPIHELMYKEPPAQPPPSREAPAAAAPAPEPPQAPAPVAERVVPPAEPAAPVAAPAQPRRAAPTARTREQIIAEAAARSRVGQTPEQIAARLQQGVEGAARGVISTPPPEPRTAAERPAAPAPGPAGPPAAGAAPKLSKAERQSKAGLAAAARAEAVPGYDAAAIKAMQDTAAAHAASEQAAARPPDEVLQEPGPAESAAPARSIAADAIDDHVRSLGNAGNDEAAFNAALKAVSDDPDVGKAEVTEIARQYTGITGSNPISKPAALRLIKNGFDIRALGARREAEGQAAGQTATEPVQPAELPPISAPARDPDTNRWVLFRGDDALEGDYANKGEALKARNRILTREAGAKRAATQQAILEAGAQRAAQGATPGAQVPPAMQPLKRPTPMQARQQRQQRQQGAGVPPSGGAPPPGVPPAGGTPQAPQAPVSKATASDLKTGLLASLRRIFMPRLSPTADTGATAIREAHGTMGQMVQGMLSNITNKMYRTLNSMDLPQFADFMDKFETGNISKMTPELQQIAQNFQRGFADFAAALRALPQTAQFQGVQNFFTHMWENPQAAQQFFTSWTTRGGAGSLKQRAYPTYADGIAAGLKPLSTNPAEMFTRYITSMSNFIAPRQMINSLDNQGYIHWGSAQPVGASGQPSPYIKGSPPPLGYSRIEAPWATRPNGQQAYAPNDMADLINNFYANSFSRGPTGNIFSFLQHTKNLWTMMELGFPTYHFFTEMHESIANGLANGIQHLAAGDAAGLAREWGTALGEPVNAALRGDKWIKLFNNPASGTPEQQRITAAMTKANIKPGDLAATREYNLGHSGDFITAFQRGSLANDLKNDWNNLMGPSWSKKLGVVPSLIQRSMQTFAYPLFQAYIPRLKMGALAKNMESFLALNPGATDEQLAGAARKFSDSIDNRMGEMVSDNLFMNRFVKDMGYIGLRSLSFTLGGPIREIAGGQASLLRGALQGQNRLNPQSPNFDPRTAYGPAFAMSVAGLGAVYQYLMTGKGPDDPRDLIGAPLTGGTTKQGPERVRIPGYQKDFIGYYFDPQQELWNKVAAPWQTLWEQYTNHDWTGEHPIVPPRATVPEQLYYRGQNLVGHVTPIIAKTGPFEPPKAGSAIDPVQRALGFQPWGQNMTNPAAATAGEAGRAQKAWQAGERMRNSDLAARGLPTVPSRPMPPEWRPF